MVDTAPLHVEQGRIRGDRLHVEATVEMRELLLEHGANDDLHSATRRGDLEAVRRLLDSGRLVNAQDDEDGTTALMVAVRQDKKDMAALLLERRANVDLQNRFGRSALMTAVCKRYGEKVMAELLLERGANVDLQRNDGKSALMVAVIYPSDRKGVAKLLLERGADVDLQDTEGMTALSLAIERKKKDMTALLVEHGASADVQDLPADGWRQAVVAGAAAANEVALGTMVAGLAAPLHPAAALLAVIQWAEAARTRARTLRSSGPRSADEHEELFVKLQLAAAAFLQHTARQQKYKRDRQSGQQVPIGFAEKVQLLLNSEDGVQSLTIALRANAKEFLSQSVMQQYVQRTWWGEWLQDEVLKTPVLSCSGVGKRARFVLILLLQLPLLPVVALVPPSERVLRYKDWQEWAADAEEERSFPFPYLLHLPVIKFWLAASFDLALALLFTLLPQDKMRTAPALPFLLVWVTSGLLWEAKQAKGDVRSHWANHFNRYDLVALLLSAGTLLMAASDAGNDESDEAWESTRTFAILFLWWRLLRVMLVSPTFGPYALMLNRMLFGDVLSYFLVLLTFLLVAIAAAWTPLLAGTKAVEGCAGNFGDLALPLPGSLKDLALPTLATFVSLLEATLTGDLYFECAHSATSNAWASWLLSFIFGIVTIVLLLNMLIAMCGSPDPSVCTRNQISLLCGAVLRMAKTFDNVWEAAAINYIFLTSQRTLSLVQEPPTPPPLYMLLLPFEAWKTMLSIRSCIKEGAEPNEPARKGTSTGFDAPSAALAAAKSAEADDPPSTPPSSPPSPRPGGSPSPPPSPRRRRRPSRSYRSPPSPDQTAAKQALAAAITEYIVDRQADAAQEEHWRTAMQRKMDKGFRELRKEIAMRDEALTKKIDEKLGKLDGMQEEMKKIGQVVGELR